MKQILSIGFSFILILLSLPLWADLSAAEIVECVDAVVNQPSSYSRYEQVVVTANKVKTEYRIEGYTKNGDEKQLIRYLEPSKVRDTAFLMLNHGEDIWAFFSSTGRVRLIAKHMRKQKMMGSEFTYEDMALVSIKRNYDAALLGEERVNRRRCYRLELVPKSGTDISYGKVVAFADRENFVVLRLDYYRKGESEPYKRMVQGKVRSVDGVPTPHLIVMKNLETGAQTAIQVLEVDYEVSLSDDEFTTTALQR